MDNFDEIAYKTRHRQNRACSEALLAAGYSDDIRLKTMTGSTAVMMPDDLVRQFTDWLVARTTAHRPRPRPVPQPLLPFADASPEAHNA